MGRFISADAYTSTGQGLLGNNMFAYCNNNPVNYSDPAGTQIQTKQYSEDPVTYILQALLGGNGSTSGAVAASAAVLLGVAVCTSTDAIAQANENNAEAKCYTVYFLSAIGDPTKEIVYVGRVLTANIDSRMAYHLKQGHSLVSCITGLTYEECRAIEQGGMMYHHTINHVSALMNQIRGVSPTNQNRGKYFLAIMDLVSSGLYPDSPVLPISYWVNLLENEWLNVGS